jgi:hypothetical protein
MARDRLDGLLVTRCDVFGSEIRGLEFVGRPGLTEFFGLGVCMACRDSGDVDLVSVLLGSPFLTPEGRRAVRDFLALSAPPPVHDLFSLLRGELAPADRLVEGRDN